MNRAILILLPFLLPSCAIVGGDQQAEIDAGEIVLQTDQTAYTAQQDPEEEWPTYSFTLVAQFENRSGRTLYLATCNPSSVHPIHSLKLMDKESSTHSEYSGINSCSGNHDPIIIDAGSVRTDTLQITGPGAWEPGTHEPIGTLEGSFRLVYEARTCAFGDGCVIPDSLSWSNEFEVQIKK